MDQADSVAMRIYLQNLGDEASEVVKLILDVCVTMNKSLGFSLLTCDMEE